MVERSEQELVRIAKLAELRKECYPFPNDVRINASSKDVYSLKEGSKKVCTVAGRIVSRRLMGKAAFIHILDGAGRLQIYVRRDKVGEKSFAYFKDFDIGDIVECIGTVFVTKTGEKSLFADSIRLLTKSLIPLPEKWHGLKDVEARYRQRYVDLISNPEVRGVFRKRARIINLVRKFLDERGYLEVETPVLQGVAGGATARPFVTHHNTLDQDMYMRIALELPLKKLIVGGFERVYEIGRIFRNEGISKKHNPEFTMLEFYQAYSTFDDLMDLTEEMISGIVRELSGGLKIRYGDNEVDFTPPWKRISMLESIYEIGEISRTYDLNSLEGVVKAAAQNGIELKEPESWGYSLVDLFDEVVEHKLISPTFISHHPLAVSPLARINLKDERVTDRFELIIAGMEVANAFSELNDPEDQRRRFEEQAKRKAQGDEEAPDVEEDFLRALEYGMPPTAGEGIGIDRLVMLLTDSHTIRDVVLFPQMRPEGESIPSGKGQEG